MIKFSKLIITIFLLLLIIITYLSFIGVETKRFNNQIEAKIKKINKNLSIELNEVKIILDPLKFKLKIKTLGPKLKNQNKVIEIENIKTQISLGSLLKDQFSVENLEISTKSIIIKDLISFIRASYNKPELYILETIIKKGYLIADLSFEFNEDGKIKNNYEIKGFIKDTDLSILEKYNVNKANLIFNYKQNNLELNDIQLFLNNLNFFSDEIFIKKLNNEFLVNGNFNNKKIDLDNKFLELFSNLFLKKLKVEKILFSSKNIFSFKLNNKFQFKDFDITSSIEVDNMLIENNYKLKSIFPKIKKKLNLSNHKLKIVYNQKNLRINGNGSILIQNENDYIDYQVNKKKEIISFDTSLKINQNPLNINFLNYEKDINKQTIIKLRGSKNKDNKIKINELLIKEENNKIEIKDLILNNKLQVVDLNKIDLNYLDKEKQKNSLTIIKKNKKYLIKGLYFNANSFIDNLLFEDEKETIILANNQSAIIDIEKVRLDKDFELKKLYGNLVFKNQKLINGKLAGNFANEKKLEFSVTSNGDRKATTLFMDYAEPVVNRYKFIKGFDEGILDFYSTKIGDESNSTLKIYDFKLKELPALTKILTLASLQGIADILSGEGIRFDEFEMNFKNKKSTLTIDEIYAIGPAISILMDGYVEKNKTISLRGTLVPATTINKFIGSLPVLGKLLVGSKTGEGVFGVSFKIKGPPKELETTVNPIKTLTPRFITRTLERIKKN